MKNIVKCLAVLRKVTIVRLQETVSNFAIINEKNLYNKRFSTEVLREEHKSLQM